MDLGGWCAERGRSGGGGDPVEAFVSLAFPRFVGLPSDADERPEELCTGGSLFFCRIGAFFPGCLFVSACLPSLIFELVWGIWPALPGEFSRPPVPEPDLSPHLLGWGTFRGIQSLDGDGWCRCVDAFVLSFPSIDASEKRSCAAELWLWLDLLPSLVCVVSLFVRVFLQSSALCVYVLLVCLYGTLCLFCDV